MTKRIYSVDKVELSLQKSLLPNLLIEARGRTLTSGWTNIGLARHEYVLPPADGLQGFDLVGQQPDPNLFVMQVLTRVRADTSIQAVDIQNYWGENQPLTGIRCHAQTNAKVALFTPAHGIAPVTEHEDSASTNPIVPLFQRDIRPLFRGYDIDMMIAVRNLDLSAYADVAKQAELIYERLLDGSMPCDGGWPLSDVGMFRRWIDLGLKE